MPMRQAASLGPGRQWEMGERPRCGQRHPLGPSYEGLAPAVCGGYAVRRQKKGRRKTKVKENMVKIAPSILSADFCNLEREIQQVHMADLLHVDVMDGAFVPNITLGLPVLRSIRKHTDMQLDVHLMIDKPVRYVAQFCEAGADRMSVHLEADHPRHIQQALDLMGEYGVKKSVALRPITSPEAILPYIHQLDMVLVMTVEPGFGGQPFMESQLKTIARVREIIEAYNPHCDLEVDGGINAATARQVVQAGANVLVAGSAVYESPDIPAAIAALRAAGTQV